MNPVIPASNTLLLFQACEVAASATYLVLSITALFSLCSPTLTLLSKHGKLRVSEPCDKIRGSGERNVGCMEQERVHLKLPSRLGVNNSSVRNYILHNKVFFISKKRFSDFYIFGFLWAAFLLSKILTPFEMSNDSKDEYGMLMRKNMYIGIMVPSTLLLTHLLRRIWECIFVHSWGEGRMHVSGYLLGMLHYFFLPFPLFKGMTRAAYSYQSISTDGKGHEGLNMGRYGSMCAILGIILNIYGQILQHDHHKLLASYRVESSKVSSGRLENKKIQLKTSANNDIHKDNEVNRYSIPHGQWFEYVSCPHYLAEIMIYLSFAILVHIFIPADDNDTEILATSISLMIRGSEYTEHLASLVCIKLAQFNHIMVFVWVVINLSISARGSHKWYHETFGSAYPSKRKIILPFIW